MPYPFLLTTKSPNYEDTVLNKLALGIAPIMIGNVLPYLTTIQHLFVWNNSTTYGIYIPVYSIYAVPLAVMVTAARSARGWCGEPSDQSARAAPTVVRWLASASFPCLPRKQLRAQIPLWLETATNIRCKQT